jgi:hypothetical protein
VIDNRIIIAKVPSLLRTEQSESKALVPLHGMTIRQAIAEYMEDFEAHGYKDFVIQTNGCDADLDASIQPGDFVSITPKHGDPITAIQGIIWTALWYAGAYAAINVTSAILATALIVGGGMLVSNMFSAGAASKSSGSDSPTYGFNAVNSTTSGYPVAVVYGHVRTTPQILASYRRVSTDYNMWVYVKLGLGAGTINNAIAATDVFLGDEPISNYTEYYLAFTSGETDPTSEDEAALADKFSFIPHDRGLDRQLKQASTDDAFMLETMGQVDRVMLMITFPFGKFSVDDEGGFNDMPVDMYYGYRLSGDAGSVTWAPLLTLEGKGTQALRKEIWITLPARGKYEIYIARDTDDDPEDESKRRSSSFLTSLTEILDIFQSPPGIRCCVLGVLASENLSGALPAIKVVQNRTAITVPGWDGLSTQVVDPTTHAWAFFDALTNPYSGRGISPTKILQTPWEEWEEWTEGLVSGSRRAQFNMVFDAPGNLADNCIKYIEETGRCKIIRSGDYWSVAVDKPKELASYTFGRGNIVKDSFRWEGFEDPEKVDAVQITYYDKDRNWKKKSVFAQASWYDALTIEPMVAKLELLTCNNRDQAAREAILRSQKNEYITRHGSLASLFAAAGLELLDRVDIVHRSIPFGSSGRLTGIPASAWPEEGSEEYDEFDPDVYVVATTLYLDQLVNMPSADYSGKTAIVVIDYLGNRHEYTVTGPFDVDARYVTISGGAFTGKRFDIFIVGRPDYDKLAYQITAKKIYSKQQIAFDVVEYNELMFYHTDYESGNVAI